MASQPTADSEAQRELPMRTKDHQHSEAALVAMEEPPESHSSPTVRESNAHDEAANEVKPHITLADADEHGALSQSPSAREPESVPVPSTAVQLDNLDDQEIEENLAPKKKKKKSKSSKKKTAGPSGFEEYYVDPPVTPDEFKTENDLYASNRPFTERIQIAIQRYTAKRKLDSLRRAFWVRYLIFGGVQSGPKQFAATDKETIPEDATAADIITLRATEYVDSNIVVDELGTREDEDHDPAFVVDFNGVVSSFLSITVQGYFDLTSPEAIRIYCGVLRNWLNYLLHHNVCNEYKDDINAARKTVDQAEKELTAMVDLPGLLPGTVGAACTAIYVDPSREEDFQWGSLSKLQGLKNEDAHRIFLAALAALGSDELCDLYTEQNEESQTKIVESHDTGLEVTGIHPPSKEVRDMYKHPTNHTLTPVGYITARTWHCPWAGYEDMTEEEEAALSDKQAAEVRNYTFWMDEDTLSSLYVGMKLMNEIHKLSFGIWFIENVKIIYPSFAMWIANDLMEGWKEHRYLPPKKEEAREEALEEAPEEAPEQAPEQAHEEHSKDADKLPVVGKVRNDTGLVLTDGRDVDIEIVAGPAKATQGLGM